MSQYQNILCSLLSVYSIRSDHLRKPSGFISKNFIDFPILTFQLSIFRISSLNLVDLLVLNRIADVLLSFTIKLMFDFGSYMSIIKKWIKSGSQHYPVESHSLILLFSTLSPFYFLILKFFGIDQIDIKLSICTHYLPSSVCPVSQSN